MSHKYQDLIDFARSLKVMGATGCWIVTNDKTYTVGQPTTQKKFETKKEMRTRWMLFNKRGGK